MSLDGFTKTLRWLTAERNYQQEKFNYESESDKPVEYWEQQFDSYIQRLRVFPSESLQYSQAALKLAATAVALCEHLADRDQLPMPGVPSGEIEPWTDEGTI
jgi:hypothetical protein